MCLTKSGKDHSRHSSWLEHLCANSFRTLYLVVRPIKSYKRSQIFPSKLSSSGCSHTPSFFTYEEHKAWLVTCRTLSPRMPDLFMTSLVQTAGHKMAAPKCRVSETFKSRFFLTNITSNQEGEKTAYEFLCISLYSVPVLCALRFCSLSTAAFLRFTRTMNTINSCCSREQ